ncbi:MAG: hypothetical protein LBP57_02460 [Endomicrobium sp.]|nr:hypothetical protein [Endomicrobium sp.]
MENAGCNFVVKDDMPDMDDGYVDSFYGSLKEKMDLEDLVKRHFYISFIL